MCAPSTLEYLLPGRSSREVDTAAPIRDSKSPCVPSSFLDQLVSANIISAARTTCNMAIVAERVTSRGPRARESRTIILLLASHTVVPASRRCSARDDTEKMFPPPSTGGARPELTG